MELFRLNAYRKLDWQFSYLKTKDDVEIDLVIERPGRPLALIGIKSTNRLKPEKFTHFLALASDLPESEIYILSQDPRSQQIGRAQALHWQQGIQTLWDG